MFLYNFVYNLREESNLILWICDFLVNQLAHSSSLFFFDADYFFPFENIILDCKNILSSQTEILE